MITAGRSFAVLASRGDRFGMHRWLVFATLASAFACEAAPAELEPGGTSGWGGAGGEQPDGGAAQGTGGFEGLVSCSLAAPCAADEYCVFWSYRCGADGGDGYCSDRPNDCPATTGSSVCACDNEVHADVCEAATLGQDLNAIPGACDPVARTFECGYALCNAFTDACMHWIAPNEYWSCEPLPDDCPVASCTCFQAGECGCEVIDGHVMLGCGTE